MVSKTHAACSAELTTHFATSLRRYAERHALAIGDECRLYVLALRGAEEVLLCAIGRCRDLEWRRESEVATLLDALASYFR